VQPLPDPDEEVPCPDPDLRGEPDQVLNASREGSR